jgi:hypothetical protein
MQGYQDRLSSKHDASFKLDNVGVAQRLEFDPLQTKIDHEFVYGKPMRDASGKIMIGPEGAQILDKLKDEYSNDAWYTLTPSYRYK